MRVACVVGVLLLAGCGESSDPAPDAEAPLDAKDVAPPPGDDVLARGRAAWDQGMCAMCHGADGTGGQLGPDLTEGPWQHADGTIPSIVAVLRTGIPKEEFRNSAYLMPMVAATTSVPASELEALAEYVRALRE